METITRKKLAQRFADFTGQPVYPVDESILILLQLIGDELVQGNRIELRNFGVFSVKQRKARIARIVKTGEKIRVPARRVIVFKPGRSLKRKIVSGQGGN
jgi:integration host factor subunit beta